MKEARVLAVSVSIQHNLEDAKLDPQSVKEVEDPRVKHSVKKETSFIVRLIVGLFIPFTLNMLLAFDVIQSVENVVITPERFVKCTLTLTATDQATFSNATFYDFESSDYVSLFGINQLSSRFEISLQCKNESNLCNISVDLISEQKSAVMTGVCPCTPGIEHQNGISCIRAAQMVSDWLFYWPYIFLPINILGFHICFFMCLLETASWVSTFCLSQCTIYSLSECDTRIYSILSLLCSIGEFLCLLGGIQTLYFLPIGDYSLPTSLMYSMAIMNAYAVYSNFSDLLHYKLYSSSPNFELEAVLRWGRRETRCFNEMGHGQKIFFVGMLLTDILSFNVAILALFISVVEGFRSGSSLATESWELNLDLSYLISFIVGSCFVSVVIFFSLLNACFYHDIETNLQVEKMSPAAVAETFATLRLSTTKSFKRGISAKILEKAIQIANKYIYERPVQYYVFKGLVILIEHMKTEQKSSLIDVFIRMNFVDHVVESIHLHKYFDNSVAQEEQKLFKCSRKSNLQTRKLFLLNDTVSYLGASTIRGFVQELEKQGRHDEAQSYWEIFLRRLGLLSNESTNLFLDIGKNILITGLGNGKLLFQRNIISFGLSNNGIAYPSNVHLRTGRWYFEVCVQNTPSYAYIGWCDNLHPLLDPDIDDENKFNTSKKNSFNLKEQCFGDRGESKLESFSNNEKWKVGDYVGSSIDMETRKIQYYWNGVHVKEFDLRWETSKTIGDGVFPTVRGLSLFQCTMNLGNEPFQYPTPNGYHSVYDSVS